MSSTAIDRQAPSAEFIRYASLMTSDPTATEEELTATLEEEVELRRNATVANFATNFGLAAACWAVVFLVSLYNQRTNGELGWLGLPILLVFVPAIIGAFFFSGFFLYEWLAIATILTPQKYRQKTHLFGAIVLASLYTFLNGDPLSALRKTLIYLEHHGFFVLKLLIIGSIVGMLAHSLARNTGFRDFPRYPLRWYALLTVSSMIVGATLVPDGDISSQFHWYAETAHYTGTVIVSFVFFYFGARSGKHPEKKF